MQSHIDKGDSIDQRKTTPEIHQRSNRRRGAEALYEHHLIRINVGSPEAEAGEA